MLITITQINLDKSYSSKTLNFLLEIPHDKNSNHSDHIRGILCDYLRHKSNGRLESWWERML